MPDTFLEAVLTAPQVCGQDVLRGNQQLLAEVCRFRRAVGQQLQHAFYHLLRIFSHQLLSPKKNNTNTTIMTLFLSLALHLQNNIQLKFSCFSSRSLLVKIKYQSRSLEAMGNSTLTLHSQNTCERPKCSPVSSFASPTPLSNPHPPGTSLPERD